MHARARNGSPQFLPLLYGPSTKKLLLVLPTPLLTRGFLRCRWSWTTAGRFAGRFRLHPPFFSFLHFPHPSSCRYYFSPSRNESCWELPPVSPKVRERLLLWVQSHLPLPLRSRSARRTARFFLMSSGRQCPQRWMDSRRSLCDNSLSRAHTASLWLCARIYRHSRERNVRRRRPDHALFSPRSCPPCSARPRAYRT